MGQAKQRGTFEQRKAGAVLVEAARQAEMTLERRKWRQERAELDAKRDAEIEAENEARKERGETALVYDGNSAFRSSRVRSSLMAGISAAAIAAGMMGAVSPR